MKGVDYKIIGADGREYAASTLDELRTWVEEGRVAPGTWVWHGQEQRWRPAIEWPELRWDLPAAPPVMPVQLVGPAVLEAEFPMRAAAFLIDMFIVGALFSVVTMPWAEELRSLQEAGLREAASEKPDLMVILRFYAVFLGTFLPVRMAYSVGLQAGFGATLGKMLFGLRVVKQDGEPLTYPRAALRFVAELVSASAMGVGYLIAPFHPERRALHDLVAGTRVIRRPVDSAVIPDKA